MSLKQYQDASRTAAATGGAVVVPHAVTLLPVTRSLWIGTAGDIAVVFVDGTTVTHKVPVGVFPVQVVQVLASGTTAADIVAWY